MEGDIPSALPQKFLSTIPRQLKSLIGTSISIRSENPQDVIESLGEVLGITDYKSNMVSFWFLDVLALQILRCRNDLDDYSRSLLISWLSGEMNLIREKKFCREDFFKQMEFIFNSAANGISDGGRLLFWEKFISTGIGDDLQVDMEEQDVSETERSSSRKSSGQKQYSPRDNVILVEMCVTSRSEFPSSIDPLRLLEIIMDSTYNMYASELRYALVYAVFVEQIELQTYHIPFLIRAPRPIKPPEANVQAVEAKHQKTPANGTSSKELNKAAGKKKKSKRRSKTIEMDLEVPPTPPRSEEEQLKARRAFILPLIEAKEAEDVLKGNRDSIEE